MTTHSSLGAEPNKFMLYRTKDGISKRKACYVPKAQYKAISGSFGVLLPFELLPSPLLQKIK